MIGAIAGDIIGSVYEHRPIKTKEFPLFVPESRFTDDAVLTLAVADAILSGYPYADAIRGMALSYPRAGYGGLFIRWFLSEDPRPYNSYGNGSAMRVSPVGFAFSSEEEVLRHARMSAVVTHDHPEGIKGAEAVALAIFLARTGLDKEGIRARISAQFGYDLDRSADSIRPSYSFDITCQGTVPEALIAFLDSGDYEDAVRTAVSLGGDSDTLACITGGIAHAFYGGIPEHIRQNVEERLTPDLRHIAEAFCRTYNCMA